MIQQLYPSVAHPYSFELNKDFNFSAKACLPDSLPRGKSFLLIPTSCGVMIS